MRFLVITFFVLASFHLKRIDAYSADQKAIIAKAREVCAKQSKADADLIEKTKQGIFTDDTKLKDYVLCVSMKFNFIDSAGTIHKDVITKQTALATGNQQVAEDLFKKCGSQEGSPKEKIYKMVDCYFKTSPISII